MFCVKLQSVCTWKVLARALGGLVTGVLAAAVLCIIPAIVVWICYAIRNDPEGQKWAEVTAGCLGGLVFLPLCGFVYVGGSCTLADELGNWMLVRASTVAIPLIFGALFPLASGTFSSVLPWTVR